MQKKVFHFTRPAALLFLLFTAGCTTIEIGESDAFDNHQTVTPASFTSEFFTLTELSIPSGSDANLNAWWLQREDARHTVIYFGGNGFLLVKSKHWISAWEKHPVNLMLFDYRGYGLSTGTPTVGGIMADSDTVYHYVTDTLNVEPESIIFHGHSMGSFVAGRAVGEYSGAAYILESPITEAQSWSRMLVPWLLRPFIRFRFDEAIAAQNNLERVRSTEKPLLILAGDEDQITPKKMAKELYEHASSPLKTLAVLEGGDHNNLPEKPAYHDALQAFLEAIEQE